jgi:transcriptional regulator with XRE-family HTH domain
MPLLRLTVTDRRRNPPNADAPPQTLGQRLEFALDELGLNKNQLAMQLGVAPSFVGAVAKDGKRPGADFLEALQRHYRISTDWLLTGFGCMFLGATLDFAYYRAIVLQVAIVERAILKKDPSALRMLSALRDGASAQDLRADTKIRRLVEECEDQSRDSLIAASIYNATVSIPDAGERVRASFEAAIAHAESRRVSESPTEALDMLAQGRGFGRSAASAYATGQGIAQVSTGAFATNIGRVHNMQGTKPRGAR